MTIEPKRQTFSLDPRGRLDFNGIENSTPDEAREVAKELRAIAPKVWMGRKAYRVETKRFYSLKNELLTQVWVIGGGSFHTLRVKKGCVDCSWWALLPRNAVHALADALDRSAMIAEKVEG